MRTRLVRVALVGVALALLGAGCGDDDDDAEDENPLVAAADATIAAETGVFAVTATITGIEGTDGPVDIIANGTFSFPDQLLGGEADLESLFGALRDQLGLPGVFDNLFDEPIGLVSDGQYLYLDFPLLAMTEGGSDWVKVDTGVIAGGSLSVASDPSMMVRLLGGANRYSDEGEEEVGGVPTTHYSGTLTLEGAIAAAPEDERDRLEAALEGLDLDEGAMTRSIPFDAWIDDDDLIRAAEVELGVGASGSAAIRIEFDDFGADVDIEVPEDAVDVTDTLGDVGG